MSSRFPSKKSSFLIILIPSILAFGVTFLVAYHQDQKYVFESSHLVLSHLVYAFQLKDDMAIVDWSHDMERSGSILAFKASNNSKVVAEGGNRNFLPDRSMEGVSYDFPSQWSFYWRSPKNSQSLQELVLRYRTWPGPFQWGTLGFFLCVCAGAAGRKSVPSDPNKNPPLVVAPPKSATNVPRPIKPVLSFSADPKNSILLDKNFVIQQITPEAAELFKKKPSDLLYCHLLDLTPDPLFMQSIEQAEETLFPNPFLSYPQISVQLKADPNGTILQLEKTGSAPSKTIDFVDFSDNKP